ncbi:hypothetical protein EG328_002461 [Venturia inaequalis]|uniref:rhamnogalacturonan endolyase n=1 Tax=Venturia inaequalis TaxID=5025 RepID=A0A8H3Z1P7_VENIN|nr:hypothetical protein EG328_002461 [Venturia inaequalis]
MKLLNLTTWLLAPSVALAAWGFIDDGRNFVIDTGAFLIVKVSKTNGDMTSIRYKNVEYCGNVGRFSHVESGLGPSTVTIRQFPAQNVIKVNVIYRSLKHDLVFRLGNPNVYIFTNKADGSVPASRYVVRIPPGIFNGDPNTDTDWIPSNSAVIEAGDVTKIAANGHTYSKHYSGLKYGRTIDYDAVGFRNANVGMYMIRSNHEKASGGPFFRSLLRRGAAEGPDLYDIYYYSMGNTDVQRFGLQGPSVLHFTDGGAPPNGNLFARRADWSWIDALAIDGWVPASRRGVVAGVGLGNMKRGPQYVIGLKNNFAQYWTTAGANGAWLIDKVLPGTYVLNVFKGELEVHTGTVTVAAGAHVGIPTITCADPQDALVVWRIGAWDGTPQGFLNFEDVPMKPTYMHPSDSRLANWRSTNFIIGTSTPNQFPGYMWKDVNSDHLIYFRLSPPQLTRSFKIRIGVTEGVAGGRPGIQVNAWMAPLPLQKTEGDTRSLTVGTYRGNNQVYEFIVPPSAWAQNAADFQILKVSVISGKTGAAGDPFLSSGVSFDAIEMIMI